VRIVNAGGTDGRATGLATALTAKGFHRPTSVTSSTVVSDTTIDYGPGQRRQAQTLAGVLKLPASAISATSTAGVTLTIGSDWSTGTTYPTRAGAADTRRKAALGQAHAQTATAASCVPVSTQLTVTVNDVPMTPTRAFAASPDVRRSAR